MQAASAPANKLPWKPYRGPQCEARLSHRPAETTADAVREAKPKHTQGRWPAAGSHTQLRADGSHHTALPSKGRKDRLSPAELRVHSRSWDPVWPTSDTSPQGSAWLLHGSQGHCFGGRTPPGSSALEFTLVPGWDFLKNSSLETTFSLLLHDWPPAAPRSGPPSPCRTAPTLHSDVEPPWLSAALRQHPDPEPWGGKGGALAPHRHGRVLHPSVRHEVCLGCRSPPPPPAQSLWHFETSPPHLELQRESITP